MKKEPINILIVEDNEAHIELARRAFESRAGAFSVTAARTLKEARTHLAASTPDLMFVDLTLPDGNGIELLTDGDRELNFAAIILTASSDVYKAVGAMKAGALDYMIKSDDTFADLPHIADRALREWNHIIEHRRAEEKVRGQNRFLYDTINSLSHPFYVIDANDYTIKLANTACRFDNLHDNLTCYAITHKRDKPCHHYGEQCPVKIVKATKRSATVEHTHYDKSGNSRIFEVHAHPILDDGGNVIQIIEYSLDITERRQAEGALQRSKKEWEQTFNAMSDWVSLVDLDFRIVRTNRAAEDFLGLPPAEVLGQTCYKLVHCSDESHKQCPLKKMRSTHQRETMELKIKDSCLMVAVEPVTDKEGNLVGAVHIVSDITERRRAEEELRASESKYRSLFLNMLNGFAYCKIILDENNRPVDFTYLEINDAFEKLTGLKRETVIGEKVTKAIPEIKKSNPELFDIYGKVALTGEPTSFEILIKPLGIWLYISVYCPQKGFFVAVFDNITERKIAEEALRESEAKFRTLVTNTEEVVYMIDKDGIFLLSEGKGLSKLGLKPGQVVGKSVFELYKDYPDMLNAMRKALDGKTVTMEVNVGDNYFRSWYTPHMNHEGEIIGLLGLSVNITERKQAEEALRESEEKYKGLVENIGIGISLISPQMEILSLNRKMREWFPAIDPSKKARCYESYSDPPKKKICSYCPAVKTLEDGNVHEAVSETPAGNGTKNYRIVSSPIKDVAGNIVAVIEMVEDVTEKLRIEKELARAGKLESIGILAGGIAHDFNNILAGFLGSVSRAKMDLTPGSETYKALERAETASIRAERLTDQLLTFSKGGAPIKEKASVAELVRDTAGFTLSGSNVGCEFLIPDNIWEAKIDKGQISQVVQNLVINAAQAMPGGGKIVISVENLRIGSKHRLPLYKGKYVKISVRDDGIGIPDDYLQKIFDPYFTTKQRGSGLGLATVYSIVKNHDGHIDVSSEPGVGTTFDIYLPSTGKMPSKERIPEAKIVHGTGKVLVVDDEEIIRITLGDILVKIGYEAQCVADGQEAIELYKNEKDRGRPFDIVILDLTIPGGMGGKEAIVKLREIDPDVKAVVSSGYATDPVVATFKEHGFSGYLKKPYKASDLSMVLCDILQGESAG